MGLRKLLNNASLICHASCRPDIATDLDEAAVGAEGAEADGDAGEESAATAFVRGADETAEAYARRIFSRVFEEDIVRVLSMEVCSKLRLF